jgi:hypothetical protein
MKPRRGCFRMSTVSFALFAGVSGWVLWEQSLVRPWEPGDTFQSKPECLQALTHRAGVLEAASRGTTTPWISEVYEIAATLRSLDDQRLAVFLVCLPSGHELRPGRREIKGPPRPS